MRRRFFNIRRLYRDNRGIAAIEAALYLPLLALVLQALIEFGMIMFVATLTEGALRDATRFGITGREVAGQTRVDFIKQSVSENLIGLIDAQDTSIEIKTYPSFADIEKGEPFVDGNGNSSYDVGETFSDQNGNGVWDADMGVEGAGGAGQVVLYKVQVNWRVMNPMMKPFLDVNNGAFPISSSMAVRNEPWEN